MHGEEREYFSYYPRRRQKAYCNTAQSPVAATRSGQDYVLYGKEHVEEDVEEGLRYKLHEDEPYGIFGSDWCYTDYRQSSSGHRLVVMNDVQPGPDGRFL